MTKNKGREERVYLKTLRIDFHELKFVLQTFGASQSEAALVEEWETRRVESSGDCF